MNHHAVHRLSLRTSELLRLSFLMVVTMTLHNAYAHNCTQSAMCTLCCHRPEGFAVAFSAYSDVGTVMAMAIATHNIPEV